MDLCDVDKRDVRRPMNAFLIFCKRHRSIVREKNPDLDNRSVTRILGDMWANLKDPEKTMYTDLAKQYKDAFMKANPHYKWHNPEKAVAAGYKTVYGKPTNTQFFKHDVDMLPVGPITPGKLADPANMGGLSLLLMAGQHTNSNNTLSKPLSAVHGPSTVVVEQTFSTTELSENTLSRPDNCDVQNAFSSKSGHSLLPMTTSHKCQGTCGDCKKTIECPENSLPVEDKAVTGVETQDLLMENQIEEMKKQANPSAGMSHTESNHYGGPHHSGHCKADYNCSSTDHKIAAADRMTSDMLPQNISKTSCSQTIFAAKIPHRCPLGQTFLDTSEQMDNPVIKDNCVTNKTHNSESLLDNNDKKAEPVKDEITDQKQTFPDILKDNFCIKVANIENQCTMNETLVEILDGQNENTSTMIMNNVKENEEESMLVTCVKHVVNVNLEQPHSSDIAIAASKMTCKNVSVGKCLESVKGNENNGNKASVSNLSNVNVSYVTDMVDNKSDNKSTDNRKHVYQGEESSNTNNYSAKNETKTEEVDYSEKTKMKHQPIVRKQTIALLYKGRDDTELENEESGEFSQYQPVRKSHRRNRGQRYQELIKDGIIQPSKERMAALQKKSPKDESTNDEHSEITSLNSNVLPDAAIRRFRKRTTSESAKDKILHIDDPKRYKTGDFDLEAQIATLPSCSVESIGRKRGFARQRHSSENTHIMGRLSTEHLNKIPVFDLEKAVSLPPHIKLPSSECCQAPVVGSRKRKARKHSITHLLPAPLVMLGNGKIQLIGNSSIKPVVSYKSTAISQEVGAVQPNNNKEFTSPENKFAFMKSEITLANKHYKNKANVSLTGNAKAVKTYKKYKTGKTFHQNSGTMSGKIYCKCESDGSVNACSVSDKAPSQTSNLKLDNCSLFQTETTNVYRPVHCEKGRHVTEQPAGLSVLEEAFKDTCNTENEMGDIGMHLHTAVIEK